MKVPRPRPRAARIEMLPLIDIVFLVLVVFIYAMLAMAVHRGLPVSLPQSAAVGIERETALTVNIQADGAVFLNRRPLGPGQLSAALRAESTDQADPAVLLFAHRDLNYQQLFAVLGQIRAAGLSRISLQAEAPAAPAP